VSSLNVLTTGEEDGAKIVIGHRDTAFFKATEADFVCSRVFSIVETVSKEGGKSGKSGGNNLKVSILQGGKGRWFENIGEGDGVVSMTDAVVDGH